MHSKKFFSILIICLIIAVAISLVACQNNTEKNSSGDNNSNEEINSGDSDLPSGEDTSDDDDIQEVDPILEFTETAQATYQLSAVKNKNISEVIIPNTYNGKPVTSIADKVFENCTSLTSVEIPKSIVDIGYSVFDGCVALTIYCNIEQLPNNWQIDWNKECPIVWDSKNNDVADDGYIYTIYQGMRYAIKDNQAQVARQPMNVGVDIVIPNAIIYNDTTYTVTSVGELAFSGCSNLESIKMTDNILIIEDAAFIMCNNLQSVVLGNNTTIIGKNVFNNCTSLVDIILPQSLQDIGDMAFAGCSALKEIVIPSSVQTIGSGAFGECNQLLIYCETTEIPTNWHENWNYSNCKYILNAIKYIDTNEEYNYKITPQGTAVLMEGKKEYTDPILNIPSKIDGYTIVGFEDIYAENQYIQTVNMPDSITTIGKEAFYGCRNLIEVTIGKNVKYIGVNVFEECENLEKIYYLGTIADWCSVSFDIYSMFYSQEWREKLYIDGKLNPIQGDFIIPNGVESIGDSAFENNQSLTNVTIPNSVVNIGMAAFYACSNLMSITIPDSVINIEEAAFYNNNMVIYCEAKTKPTGWHDNWNMLNCCPVVWDCNNNQVADDGYVYTVIDSIRYALKDNEAKIVKQPINLSGDIKIPNNVTYNGVEYDVTRIDEYAFSDCNNLTSITIPNSVISIGVRAFSSCSSLTSITFENPNNWQVSTSSDFSSYIEILSEDLSNSSTAATYLTFTYKYYWRRVA